MVIGRYDLNEVEGPVRAIYALTPLIDHLGTSMERPTFVRHLVARLGLEENYVLRALDGCATAHASQRLGGITRALT
jgi:hypothetical protein